MTVMLHVIGTFGQYYEDDKNVYSGRRLPMNAFEDIMLAESSSMFVLLLITRETNVYCNYGSQEAGLVKHKLHPMNRKSIWYNKTRYKIHIIQYTVHNIKGRIKHFHLLFWKWARA